MSADKLENTYKLLSEYNFNTIKCVSDKFKCGKCRKILIEACQTKCGCKFCRCCVDEMMKNECQHCPGITNDCKMVSLSTVQIDYRTNNKISKLIMKCPAEICSYECELLEMREHLRICPNKSKFECDMNTMKNEKSIEYLQLENYNHNKTLIDMVNNVKNEIKELRENEKKNLEEINKLKIDLQLTNEKLESINEKMEMMKIDKVKMEKQMKNVEEILSNKIEILISKHEKEIKSICENDNIELLELVENIGTLVTDLDNKINEIKKCDIKSFSDDIRLDMKECKQLLDELIMQIKFKRRINPLEKRVKNETNGIFELLITKIDKLKNHRGIWSEYFYNRIQPYKMRLYVSHSCANEMQICFCICDDEENQYLSFPFRADVTIKIINKTKRELCRSIRKYCQIDKPENDSFSLSDYFVFPLSELRKKEILELDCAVIQCSFELN